MKRFSGPSTLFAACVFVIAASCMESQAAAANAAAKPDAAPTSLALDSLQGLGVEAVPEAGVEPTKFKADVATYRGLRAVHIVNNDSTVASGNPTGGQTLAIIKGSDFKDGVIEVELVGMPREGAPDDCRGFIGVAFRVQDHGTRFEAFYLRFTNGRADEQIRRNHATQYVSQPDYPWHRLRKENPGVYESYVDIEEKAWTEVKIVVSGTKAQLYVNGAAQPCLIVNDLKLGDSRGQVALWIGSDTEAYFSQLKIK
jgi:hypothetical protein